MAVIDRVNIALSDWLMAAEMGDSSQGTFTNTS